MDAKTFIEKYGIKYANKIVIGYGDVESYMWYNYDYKTHQGHMDMILIEQLKQAIKKYGVCDE